MRITVLMVLLLVGMLFVGIPHASATIGDLQVTVKTDKGSYTSGETVLISVILTNTGTSSATLNFDSTCQASYTVEGSGRAWYSFPQVCAMALTNLTLAPGQVKVYRFSWDQKDASGNLVPSPGDFMIRGDMLSREPLSPGFAKITIGQVTVNAPPTAAFSMTPATGSEDTVFTADASASHDREDPSSALLVRWDWNGDGVWDTDWSTAKVAQHRYAAAGSYTVRLEVKDSGSLRDISSATVQVTSSGATTGSPPQQTGQTAPARTVTPTQPAVNGSDHLVPPWLFPSVLLGALAAAALGVVGSLARRPRHRSPVLAV